MPLWSRGAINLSEAELRYAMETCRSIREMSVFFGVSHASVRVYLRLYYDHEHGMSFDQLFKLKRKTMRKGTKNNSYSPNNAPMEDILGGKHPKYNPEKLQNRLIIEGYLIEQCNICGFNGRRVTDYKMPLKLAWKNKDMYDHRIENLELVCFNCFYLYYGEIFAKRYRTNLDMYKKDRPSKV